MEIGQRSSAGAGCELMWEEAGRTLVPGWEGTRALRRASGACPSMHTEPHKGNREKEMPPQSFHSLRQHEVSSQLLGVDGACRAEMHNLTSYLSSISFQQLPSSNSKQPKSLHTPLPYVHGVEHSLRIENVLLKECSTCKRVAESASDMHAFPPQSRVVVTTAVPTAQ